MSLLTWVAARTKTPGVAAGDADVGGRAEFRTSWMEFQAEKDKIGPNYNPEAEAKDRRMGTARSGMGAVASYLGSLLARE